jgi:hypothetical protein
MGDKIEVINPGEYNSDAGPDFFNAKIRIGETIWAGNVEMHIKSSDWMLHNHAVDRAYDNVILHIVTDDDKPATNSKGQQIPTVIIKYPDALEWKLMNLTSSGKWIPCEDSFASFDSFSIRLWLESLMIERLEQKTAQVFDLVNNTQGSWEEAFYQSVARSFGLKANALPFELLAKSTPLKVLGKHKDNLFQIESILFGQSGLLDSIDNHDSYTFSLQKEYKYLQHKFSLTAIDGHLWKFLRMRPTAFPTIRIAQFAMLIHKSTSLFSKIIEVDDIKEIIKLFQVDTSEYWKTHYTLGKESKSTEKRIGAETISVIAINTLVPFIFAYGISKSQNKLKDKAIKLLETIKPESNSIINKFTDLGVIAESAYDTQALIHLKSNYCDAKKCLYCHLGAKLLLKSLN